MSKEEKMKNSSLRKIIKRVEPYVKRILDFFVFYFLHPLSRVFSLIPHPSSSHPFQTARPGASGATSGFPYIPRKGQAMTEVVLLLPVFIILLVFIVKIFALLILIQKMEIASYYAARRWQLQSHLASKYTSSGGSPIDLMQYDIRLLKGSDKNSILEKVKGYIGFNDPKVKGFLNLQKVNIEVNRTMVWSVVTLTVTTDPLPQGLRSLLCRYPESVVCGTYGQTCIDGYKYLCSGDRELTVIKYVPNRDRPLKFKLPGLE